MERALIASVRALIASVMIYKNLEKCRTHSSKLPCLCWRWPLVCGVLPNTGFAFKDGSALQLFKPSLLSFNFVGRVYENAGEHGSTEASALLSF